METGTAESPSPLTEDGMVADEKLDQLSWELSRYSLGPVDSVLNEITSKLADGSGAVVSALQKAVNDQPLMTLILAAQAGYLLARFGHRYART
jgi:hypothetical protein